MKITKKPVKACTEFDCSIDNKSKAISHIKAAMECLAEVSDDPICMESIGNLTVVLVDLTPDALCCEDNATEEPIEMLG